MKVAAIQMVSGRLGPGQPRQRARAAGARRRRPARELAVLPEYFCLMGQRDSDKLAVRESLRRGPDPGLPGAGRARAAGCGSSAAPCRWSPADDAHVRNTSLVFSPAGERVARYDKIHLFRFDNGRERYDESRVIERGSEPAVFALRDRDGHDWRVGLSVCYDLRFPELYRALRADVLLVPSAFTYGTGQAHWELLLRARAVENLAYVIAPAQGGVHENGRRTWGHTHGGRPLGRGARRSATRARRGAGRSGPRAPGAAARAAARAGAPGAMSAAGCGAVLLGAVPAAPRFRAAALVAVGAADRAGRGPAGDAGVAGRPLRGQPGAKQAGARHGRRAERHPRGAHPQRAEPAGLQSGHPPPAAWSREAAGLLREHREWIRLEWRDAALATVAFADTPFRAPPFARLGRANAHADVALACANARRVSGPAYSGSYFLPQPDGLGLEVMELCLPQVTAGQLTGYVVATYSLSEILAELVGPQLMRSQEVAFTEADGTRLALHGAARRGSRVFTSQQLLDLPGNTMVLRMDSWRGAPDLFPNVLTALVTAMSIALVAVLVLLGKDMRRRLRAEQDLADALAFRKAMEDSLVTGLRARDLHGRITYVNPAFCQMVGFTRGGVAGPCDAGALLAARTGRRVPQAPGDPPGRPARAAARGLRVGVHAQGRLAFSGADHRGAADQRARHADRLDERLPGHQRAAPGGGTVARQPGAAAGHGAAGHGRRDGFAAEPRAEPAAGGDFQLRHRLDQPAEGQTAARAPARTPSADALADIEVAMRRIAEQAERAGKVIKSVHDFVRRRDKEREPVTPQALLDAIMPLVSLQARKLGVRVQIRSKHGLPPVLCDRTMVEQVLLNLARNAMQAMDQAQRGRSVAGDRGAQARSPSAPSEGAKGWLEFSVTDVGPGIPEQVQAQLFTPFFTTKAEGMGLGLSLCRTVVEQHGGFLGFEPQPSAGYDFPVHLAGGRRVAAAARLMQPALNATVFIVDDDASVREALAWLLRSRHLLGEGYAGARGVRRHAAGRLGARPSPAACCWTCACPA